MGCSDKSSSVGRNSSIELLKVFAIAMIVLSHAVPLAETGKEFHVSAIELGMATTNVQYLIAGFISNLGNTWFITCYLLYYIIHPLLNVIIRWMDKKKLLLTNVLLIMLYCIINYSLGGTYIIMDSLVLL